jgi:hypothetical protein
MKMKKNKKYAWAIVEKSGRVAVYSNGINESPYETPLIFETRKQAKESNHYYPNAGDIIKKILKNERPYFIC